APAIPPCRRWHWPASLRWRSGVETPPGHPGIPQQEINDDPQPPPPFGRTQTRRPLRRPGAERRGARTRTGRRRARTEPARGERHREARRLSRQGGVRRFLGVVVQAVPAVVPVDERDAGTLRREGIPGDRRQRRRQGRRRPQVPLRDAGEVRRRLRPPWRGAQVLGDQGNAGLVPVGPGRQGPGPARRLSRRRSRRARGEEPRVAGCPVSGPARSPNSGVPSMRATILVALVLASSACSFIDPVSPWQKGNLARPEITFEGDVLEGKFLEHIYQSKENGSGGLGVGGGGC